MIEAIFFLCSASLQDITSRFKERKYGGLWQWSEFPNKIAVQSDDTHPTLAIPELTRLLMNNEGLGWDEAWDMTSKVICISHMETELLCSGDHVSGLRTCSGWHAKITNQIPLDGLTIGLCS